MGNLKYGSQNIHIFMTHTAH